MAIQMFIIIVSNFAMKIYYKIDKCCDKKEAFMVSYFI